VSCQFFQWLLIPLDDRWIEPIADVADSLNQAGLSGIGFNFFA
jgi:hypothetical protein